MAIFRFLAIATLCISIGGADKAQDCAEIGIGRSSGHVVASAYAAAKGRVTAQWAAEDEAAQEGGEGQAASYAGLPDFVKNNTRAAYLLEETSRELIGTLRSSRVGKRCPAAYLLRGVERKATPLKDLDQSMADDLQLLRTFRCFRGSPYPNIDGSCVSEESPDLGAVGAKFLRLLTTTSGMDGFSPRQSASAAALPSARAVAGLLRRHLPAPPRAALFAEWSSLLQRDIFSMPESPYVQGVDCCLNPDLAECFHIPVPADDPLHPTASCINYRRMANAQAVIGNREAFNLESSYLDLSPLYGTSDEQAFAKKTRYFGRLVGPDPLEKTAESACKAPESWEGCFPEDEALTPSLRALLLLEHNRIADALYDMAPDADDSFLYNEARRINMAAFTALTYGSLLPALLGPGAVEGHALGPGAEGPSAAYVKEINPGVLMAHGTTTFRNPAMATEVPDSPHRDEILGAPHYDALRGLSSQDALASDVQRARDLGVPGFATLRRFAEARIALSKWEDLNQIFSKEIVEDLQKLYEDVEDVDPMLGLLEPAADEGGIVGKSFSHILIDQFARLRTGNRYYWEHDEAMFTLEQKEALKGATLSALLCANLPLEQVPKEPFYPLSEDNPLVKCADVEPFSLSSWQPKRVSVKVEEGEEGKVEELVAEEEDSSEPQQTPVSEPAEPSKIVSAGGPPEPRATKPHTHSAAGEAASTTLAKEEL